MWKLWEEKKASEPLSQPPLMEYDCVHTLSLAKALCLIQSILHGHTMRCEQALWLRKSKYAELDGKCSQCGPLSLQASGARDGKRVLGVTLIFITCDVPDGPKDGWIGSIEFCFGPDACYNQTWAVISSEASILNIHSGIPIYFPLPSILNLHYACLPFAAPSGLSCSYS